MTWVGTVSGSWHDPSNWSTGQLPGPFNDVVIDAAAGIVVTYSQGTSSIHSLTSHNDLTVTGGTLALSAATVIGGALTLADTGGLAGGDDVLVQGLFTCAGGQLGGPGTVTAAGGLALTASSSGEGAVITGCTLVNTGAAAWTGGNINVDNGAVFRNTATATLAVTCDELSVWCGQTTWDGFCQPRGAQPVFENFGTFTKSAGAGITDFRGLPDFNGGDVAFINAGTVEVQSGQIAFGRTYTQTAGSLQLTGGNISALGTLDIQGGALAGTGTVTANVQNAGVPDMGGNVGILTITGSYTQLPAGQLTARLGGLSAGTQYDQLNVAGAASLDGTLALVLIGGFAPATGDTFNLLTYASETGSFAIDTAGQSYTASYAATGLAIVAG